MFCNSPNERASAIGSPFVMEYKPSELREMEYQYCRTHLEYFVEKYGHIEDKDADAPVKTVAQELLREDLAEVLSGLSPRERDVLRLRFGMDVLTFLKL